MNENPLATKRPKTLAQLFKDPARWIKYRFSDLPNDAKGGDYITKARQFCVQGGALFLCGAKNIQEVYPNFDGDEDGDFFEVAPTEKAKQVNAILQKLANHVCHGILIEVAYWNNNSALTHEQFLKALEDAGV